MITRINNFLFILLVLSIPIQIGYHFWPSFAFPSGIRLDYLSPTLHGTDLIIIVLAMGFVAEFWEKCVRSRRVLMWILVSLFVLIVPLFYVLSIPAHVLGWVKFMEFVFVGYFATRIIPRINLLQVAYGVVAVSVMVSSHALLQFFNQASLGGLLYWIGERSFDVTTIGIATFIHEGVPVLRSYASFPHPNVLAFYLLCAGAVLTSFFNSATKKNRVLIVFSLGIVGLGMLVTFSRVIVLLYMLVLIALFVRKVKSKTILLFPVILLGGVILIIAGRFEKNAILTSLFNRIELLSIAIRIIDANLFTGVGFLNFFYHQSMFQAVPGPTLLQPVHNTYMLVLLQAGIFGFIAVLIFIYLTYKRITQNFLKTKNAQHKDLYFLCLLLFSAMLVVGMFDHFLLTLQQGQLLASLIIGMGWTRFGTR